MWSPAAPSTVHQGIAPAAAMITPFAMPCGPKFLLQHVNRAEGAEGTCAPPNFDEYWWSRVGYYSPAVCPVGFTAGCTRWDSRQGPEMAATETAVQCVSVGYDCVMQEDISMAFSNGAKAPMIQVRWATSDLTSFATHPLVPGADPTRMELRGLEDDAAHAFAKLKARGLDIRQASGTGSAEGLTTSSSSKASTTSRSGSTQSTRASTTSSSRSSHRGSATPTTTPYDWRYTGSGGGGGLSGGAIAGIVIGVIAGVLLLLGTFYFFVWRRRKQRRSDARGDIPLADYQHPDISELGQGNKPESGGETSVAASGDVTSKMAAGGVIRDKSDNPSELAGNFPVSSMAELYAQNPLEHRELPSDPRPNELDSRDNDKSLVSEFPRKEVGGGRQGMGSPWSMSSAGNDPMSSPMPDSRVSIMPGLHPSGASLVSPMSSSTDAGAVQAEQFAEPDAGEAKALAEEHARLESRRQRILKLEQIEREQAVLRQKMKMGKTE